MTRSPSLAQASRPLCGRKRRRALPAKSVGASGRPWSSSLCENKLLFGEELRGGACEPCTKQELVVPTISLACPAPVIEAGLTREKWALLLLAAALIVAAFLTGLSIGRLLGRGAPVAAPKRALELKIHHGGAPAGRPGARQV